MSILPDEQEEPLVPLTRDDPFVFHFRIGRGKEMKAKGGATVVYRPDLKRFGIALCCSKDRYNKRLGISIASQRAAIGAKTDKPHRRKSRFKCAPEYEGENELNAVRQQAVMVVVDAACSVLNREVATAMGPSFREVLQSHL